MNIEFDVAHELKTPLGNLDLNAAAGYRYLIQESGYAMLPSIRVTQDNISQADGSVLHPRYTSGVVATMTVAYNISPDVDDLVPAVLCSGIPACGAHLRFMNDTLGGLLNSIRRLSSNPLDVQRLIWQPSGYGDRRMLDQIQLLSWPAPSYDLAGTEALVAFSVESPFPYAIDETERQTHVYGGSAPTPIPNPGNADFSPVFRVSGPTATFTLTNLDDLDEQGNPRAVVYDSSRPGGVAIPGGHYAEIDFFRGTIFLDGSGNDLIAGIDPHLTDFWHLLPGSNDIQITGASCLCLSNGAWV